MQAGIEQSGASDAHDAIAQRDQADGSHAHEHGRDILSDPEEAEHLANVLSSYHAYRRTAHFSITHTRRQAFYALPSQQWNMLAAPPFNILDHLDKVDDAIDANASIAEACLTSGLALYGYDPDFQNAREEDKLWLKPKSNPSDQGKAYQTIRQLYRDWSAEGLPEREACYTPIITALASEFDAKIPRARRGDVRVLVPGAGLGRLLYEIVKNGYSAEGNELSYHQVIVSNHFLNHIKSAGEFTLYPWAFGFSNHLSRADQLAAVKVPDVHPALELLEASREFKIPLQERMSMCSGDFSEVYSRKEYTEQFEAVTTCFFVDTAPNFLTYIAAVRNCLAIGGVWVNLGPLLWHFEGVEAKERRKFHADSTSGDGSGAGSGENLGAVELTDEEALLLLEGHGFKVEKHVPDMGPTGYIRNPRSMLQSVYRPCFWVARRVS